MSIATEAASPAAPFLGPPGRMLLAEWVEARYGRTLAVYDPALGEVIDHVPAGAGEDADLAGTAARRALEDSEWSRLTASDRGRRIWRIGDLILADADELATIESIDNGKPVAVARAADDGRRGNARVHRDQGGVHRTVAQSAPVASGAD